MAGKTLESAVQDMINNVDKIATIATLTVKEQMKKDFNKAAKDAVDQYYKYKKGYYTKHGRTHSLYKIPEITVNTSRDSKKIYFSASIDLKADRLEGVYHSHSQYHDGGGSWESGGDVEATYVVENLFMQGMHPYSSYYPLKNPEDPNNPYGYELRRGPGAKPDTMLKRFTSNKEYGDKYFAKHMNKTLNKLFQLYL